MFKSSQSNRDLKLVHKSNRCSPLNALMIMVVSVRWLFSNSASQFSFQNASRYAITRHIVPLQWCPTEDERQTTVNSEQILRTNRNEWRIIFRSMEKFGRVICHGQKCLNSLLLIIILLCISIASNNEHKEYSNHRNQWTYRRHGTN